VLTVVLDNDNNRLADAAVSVLGAPSPDPMVADVLVTGQTGIGRWLEQRLSRQTGVSANLRIELPGRFIWNTVGKLVKGTASRPPFDPAVVRWAIIDAMATLPDTETFALIRTRWAQASAVEQMVLATDLGAMFDRYLAYRRDWLDRWARNQHIVVPAEQGARAQSVVAAHEPWQQWLWHQVLDRIEGYSRSHPFDVLRQYVQKAEMPVAQPSDEIQGALFDGAGQVSAESVRAVQIAEHNAPRLGRIVMFGLLDMPTEQMQMFGLLSELTDIVWFAQDPASKFWEDLVSPAQAARVAAQSESAAWLYEHEPAVLGEWGGQQRDFLTQIRQLESNGQARVVDEAMRERDGPGTDTALHTLQNAVFSLSDNGWSAYLQNKEPESLADPSLQIHGCHSLMRQVETAHDCLLAAFADIAELRADQVAVFCPDIESVQPLVRAVFDGIGVPRLPAQVSGTSAQSNPQVRAFELFLGLVQGPANVSDVLAWFDTELARTVCQLDDMQLSQLHRSLHDAGIYRDDIGEPDAPKHGWRRGFDRLLLAGFTGADSQRPIAGTLGSGHLDSSTQRSIGLVAALVAEVETFRTMDRQAVSDWASQLLAWCDRWLVSRELPADGLYQVRDALVQLTASTEPLTESVTSQTLPFGMVAAALRSQLRDPSAAARSSGSIIVAPFGSLRHVPFRVCVLLGMDHGNWPPNQATAEYDLTRFVPRFGDRSVSRQARGTFLDVVLDTSERLVITYNARDDRENKVSTPARAVVELTDYVADQCIRAGWPLDSARNALLTLHPLQPFSARRFAPSQPYSFARLWHDAATKQAQSDLQQFPVPPVATSGDGARFVMPTAVSVDELSRSLLGSARRMMQTGAGVRIADTASEPEDIEPFDIADLDRYERADLVTELVQLHRRGMDRDALSSWLAAMANMPEGEVGRQTAAALLDEMSVLVTLDQTYLNQFSNPELVESSQHIVRFVQSHPELGEILVTGRLASTYRCDDGSLIQLLAPMGEAHVRNVVPLWFQHLLLLGSGLGEPETMRSVRLLEKCPGYAKTQKPKRAELLGFPDDRAIDELFAEALYLYKNIHSEPTGLFPNTASKRLNACKPDVNPAMTVWNSIEATYSGQNGRKGEVQRPWPNALWRDSPMPVEQAVLDSLQVYGPIWQAAFGLSAQPEPLAADE
jgi:exodeoxyribonuclease V gamma subunit